MMATMLSAPAKTGATHIMTIATRASTMTILDQQWDSFTFSRYSPPQESWRCPLPPFVDSKAYDEEQAKKRKARLEAIRTLNEAKMREWEEKEKIRQSLIDQKLAEEEAAKKAKEAEAKAEAKAEPKAENKPRGNGGFHRRPDKKVRVVESHHNEARRAKKNEKRVLDKARAEFFKNSSLVRDDSWIISIGVALGMDKPHLRTREIKDKLNIPSLDEIISSLEKEKLKNLVKPEDEISKQETSDLSEEQLESLKVEEKKDEEEIQIVRSNAAVAIEEATVAFEAEVQQRLEEAKERELIEKAKRAERARVRAEINLMSRADLESRRLKKTQPKSVEESDEDEYDLSAILKKEEKLKFSSATVVPLVQLPFELRFPIWKKEEQKVEAPVIKMGASSMAEQPNVVSAATLKPRKPRICRSLKLNSTETCKNEETCRFLHNLSELKSEPCTFKKCGRVKLVGSKYKNVGDGCRGLHHNESQEDFLIRDGFLPVPAGYYDVPKVEISIRACPVVTTTQTSIVEAKVDVISCIAWKEVNTKVLSYPGQECEEVKVSSSRVVEVPSVVEVPKEVKNNKTKMCDSVSSGNPCRHGESCRYAHSVNELNILECQHGEKCLFVCNRKGTFYNSQGKFCKFIHPCESRENYFARNNIKVQVAEKKPECTNKTCTKVCNSVIQGFQCRHKACNFAHSVDELNIRPCTFPNCKLIRVNSQGKVCNVDCRNKCSFFHEGETKESFFARIVSRH